MIFISMKPQISLKIIQMSYRAAGVFQASKALNAVDAVKKYLCAWEIMFNVT